MPETVTANGLQFAYHRAGTGDRLALCLHGFPDDARTFGPLAARLAAAGFTVVMPYMRGYGETGLAPDDDYSVETLGADARALAETFLTREDCEDAILVGHDWGAIAGYAAARQDPEQFTYLVAMAVPPGFETIIWDYPRQLVRSWYVWLFQVPGLAERVLTRDEFAFIEMLWTLWSPGWDYDTDYLQGVIDTFQTEGTPEAALAYYRQFVGPVLADLVNGRPSITSLPSIEVPGLVVSGAEDACIGPALFERADEAFAADCRVIRIGGAGHFMHRERPDVVADEVVSFTG